MIHGLLGRLNRPAARFLARLPLRLEAKLIAAFLGLVALLLLLGAAGLALLGETDRRTEALIATQQRIAEYRDLEDHGHTLLIALSSALWMPGETVGKLAAEIASLEVSLGKLHPPPGAEASQVAELRQEYTRFIEIVNREYALLRAGDLDLAGAVQTEQGQPAAARLQQLTGALVTAAEAEAAQEVGAIRDAYRTARNLLIAFIAAATLIGLYLAHIFSGSVVEPLREIGARLAEIARGEFAGRVRIANRDEINTSPTTSIAPGERSPARFTHRCSKPRRRGRRRCFTASSRARSSRAAGPGKSLSPTGSRRRRSSSRTWPASPSCPTASRRKRSSTSSTSCFPALTRSPSGSGSKRSRRSATATWPPAGCCSRAADHAAAVAEAWRFRRCAPPPRSRRAPSAFSASRSGSASRSQRPARRTEVLGSSKLAYDVWGDTVNTASRMEKYGEPGRIAVSAATRALLGNQFRFEPRGLIAVKGKGELETFFLERRIGPQRYGNMVRRLAAARAAA